MKKFIMFLIAVACSTQAGQVNFSGKSVDEIFSALDQALIKVFEGRTLSEQGLDLAGKKDFENSANAALAAINGISASTAVTNGLAQLPDQFAQLTLMIDFLKGQTSGVRKRSVNDIKRLQAEAAQLEKTGLTAALQGLQQDLHAKWDADAEAIKTAHKIEKSRKEKLLFKSAKLKQEHLLTPEQQAFFNLYKQLSPTRDLNVSEMDGLLLQSGITSSRKTKLINGYAIENLLDAIGKYGYLLAHKKADVPEREKDVSYAYDIQKQLHNLYGLSKDEALLFHKAPAPAAILYKLSSIYKTIWEKLLKELGAA